MGIVQITSLPATRPIAPHDCPTCIKRRIKCDRTKPQCLKCASRGLGCPGFKTVYLKWNQGIASRGKYAGKFAPVRHADPHQITTPECRRQTPRSAVSDALNSQKEDAVVSSHHALSPPSQRSDPANDAAITSSFLSMSIFRTLIHHFCTKAVSRLTWIDQPSHPWRAIVRGFLQHSACVQLSVGSLAAAHLSMMPGLSAEQSGSFFGIYGSLRDRTLRILSAKLRSEARSSESMQAESTNAVSATEILAAMLALCYTEVFVPGSRDWKVHLRACRTIINLKQIEDWQSTSTDPVLGFLVKDVYDLEILTSTTTFDNDILPLSAMSLQWSNTVSGWAFTSLIHKITTLERERHLVKLANGTLLPVDMTIWCQRVDEAHKRTLACPRLTRASQGQALRESFQALTRVHYYATLIYSYQAFASAAEKSNSICKLTENLLKDVELIIAGSTDDLSHDLFFPLFIAGVEMTCDRTQQVFIDALFVESISKTGIWCNYPALQFLRMIWSNPEILLQYESWIDFARANVSSIGSFVVF